MSDEKKDDVQEQQTFLNGNEDPVENVETKDAPAEPQQSAPEKGEMLSPIGKKESSRNRHSPQHQEVLKKQALEQSEVKEVLVFFNKYAKPAAIAIILICVVILVDRGLKSVRIKKEANADAALMTAFSAGALEAVVDDYSSTPSGPVALMALAKEYFNAGQIDAAESLYIRFGKDYGGHDLAVQAELNAISCKMAKGQYADAHQLYSEFVQTYPDSYLSPSARMSQAACLEALGQWKEAQITYEDVIAGYPDTVWANQAEFQLKAIRAQ